MLSRRIKSLRTACQLSQTTLAQRAHVSQAFVAQLESGVQKNPNLDTLKRIAKALKVPVAKLLE